MRLDATFGKEAKCFSGVGALLHAKDLNFHRFRRAVIDREQLQQTGLQPSSRVIGSRSEYTYVPAWWIRGGHAQTIWGKFFRPRPPLPTRLERWETPDGDFVELHRLDARGREHRDSCFSTASRERFARTTSRDFSPKRSAAVGPLIFCCFADVVTSRTVVRAFITRAKPAISHSRSSVCEAETPDRPILLAGVSLGGNVLLKYLGERDGKLSPRIRGAAAVSVPFDLEKGARFISQGFSRVYDRHFLRTLRRKALAKLEQYPRLFDPAELEQARIHLRIRRRGYGACSWLRERARLLLSVELTRLPRARSRSDAVAERGRRSVPSKLSVGRSARHRKTQSLADGRVSEARRARRVHRWSYPLAPDLLRRVTSLRVSRSYALNSQSLSFTFRLAARPGPHPSSWRNMTFFISAPLSRDCCWQCA